jgi:hypothetical protein
MRLSKVGRVLAAIVACCALVFTGAGACGDDGGPGVGDSGEQGDDNGFGTGGAGEDGEGQPGEGDAGDERGGGG